MDEELELFAAFAYRLNNLVMLFLLGIKVCSGGLFFCQWRSKFGLRVLSLNADDSGATSAQGCHFPGSLLNFSCLLLLALEQNYPGTGVT